MWSNLRVAQSTDISFGMHAISPVTLSQISMMPITCGGKGTPGGECSGALTHGPHSLVG
jgi:hypothetical protein